MSVAVVSELVLRAEIPGEPIPKGRPRFGRGRTYTPARTAKAEEAIAWELRRIGVRRPLAREYALEVELRFFCSAGWQDAPDLDNLVKLAFDAANSVLWEDDAQVARVVAERELDAPVPRTELVVFVRRLMRR